MTLKSKKITTEELELAKKLIRKLGRVQGEKRVVYKCLECGTLFAHRFITYGLGHGYHINMCPCQLTANRMHNTAVVLERKP